MSETPPPRSVWWGRADWLVFVPIFLFLASFWMYLSGRDFGRRVTEAIHDFYGTRTTAESHSPWVIAGSAVIFLHSFTLFLRRRLLFGLVARPGTIASAVLFILVAVYTGLMAFANYAASFM
jgi:hypothetical protein